MDQVDWMQVSLRWLHILPVIVLAGATLYSRLVLLPAATVLADAEHDKLRHELRRRWKKWVMILITFILISGLMNFLLYRNPAFERGSSIKLLYHALFGVKFLLAMIVFFIASALVGRSSGLQKIRDHAAFWIGVNAVLVVSIVLISGVLKNIPAKRTTPAETESTARP